MAAQRIGLMSTAFITDSTDCQSWRNRLCRIICAPHAPWVSIGRGGTQFMDRQCPPRSRSGYPAVQPGWRQTSGQLPYRSDLIWAAAKACGGASESIPGYGFSVRKCTDFARACVNEHGLDFYRRRQPHSMPWARQVGRKNPDLHAAGRTFWVPGYSW